MKEAAGGEIRTCRNPEWQLDTMNSATDRFVSSFLTITVICVYMQKATATSAFLSKLGNGGVTGTAAYNGQRQ